MSKYQDRPRGEIENQQWYKNDPKRFEEEARLMNEAFPEFKQTFNSEGHAVWEGVVVVRKVRGNLSYTPSYQSLAVRFICKNNYPLSFPLVEDVKSLLSGKCPHLYGDKNAICYSFGSSTELDFESKHRVKDLYGIVQEFLVKQSVFEDTGQWPDGQPHGLGAFIIEEFDNGAVDPNFLCPCRMYGKKYGWCHLDSVQQLIERINRALRKHFGKVKLGPNSKCPCGSETKFKKCCKRKNYFGVERKHFIQLYPQLTRGVLKEILELQIPTVNTL